MLQRVTPANFVSLLRDRAQHQPDRTAFIFLRDGETESGRLTYATLDRQARAIAASLQTTTTAGDRALLVYPYEAGLEFIAAFLGCLYAGVVAVPSHPPRNRYGLADLRGRLASAQAAIGLTSQSLVSKLKWQLAEADLDSTPLRWCATEKIAMTEADRWLEPTLDRQTLAFLQYTSGSTGNPKGVMITHEGILHNQQVLQLAFGHTEESIGVGWLPLFHDMGLIGNVLQAIYLGTSCVLMSPIAFIQKPVRWLQAISHYRATTSGAPNFAYELLCRQVTEPQQQALDLSCWDLAFSGAEPVRLETIDRFVAKFQSCGFQRRAFYPCYGMAEATLFVTGGKKGEPLKAKIVEEAALETRGVVQAGSTTRRGVRSIVSCGQTWLGSKIVIADPQTLTQCAADRVGEIWVSGGGLGKGYWNQPEATDRTFNAYLRDTGEGPFLRTGDLGFLQEGELFITGRLHDVLVFWGFNHYPEQIEQTVVNCHPAFRTNGTAAFSVPVHGEERLVVVQELERNYRDRCPIDEVIEPVRWAIFQEHFVDVYALVLLKPGSLPKTPSGKIQRYLCKQKFLDHSLESLDEWRSALHQSNDIPTMIKRYLNPVIHLRRHAALTKGRVRQLLYTLMR
jgi:acyl-CoA synthetase (AMP-forming)/AMP-acid ligase II